MSRYIKGRQKFRIRGRKKERKTTDTTLVDGEGSPGGETCKAYIAG